MADRIEQLPAAGGERLAVIRVGVDFPGCRSLDDFFQGVYQGVNLSNIRADWIPTGSLERACLQLRSGNGSGSMAIDTGILSVGPALEINTVRKLTDGPFQDYSGYHEPLPAMLVQAHEWLESHTVQAVLIAGCSLGGELVDTQPSFGYDASIHQRRIGSGSAAVLIMRLAEAQRRGIRVQAVIDALAHTTRNPTGSETVQTCAMSALRAAGITPGQIGYLEVLAAGEDQLDEIEICGLTCAYQAAGLKTALSSSQVNTGWLDGMNGIAGLVRAVVCLDKGIRPGIPNWTGPKYADAWNGSSFYVLPASLTWFRPEGNGSRRAGVNLLGKDGTCGHLILTQLETENPADAIMREPGLTLLPFCGVSAAEICEKILVLKAGLENGAPLDLLGREAYRQFQNSPVKPTAVILAHSATEALREMDFALRGLPAASEKGAEWLTPLGSCYAPLPLGSGSQVAYVYPGAFNSYLGVGKDLFTLFPDMQKRFSSTAQDLGAVLCEEQLYPRSLAPLTKEQLDRLEGALLDDAFVMMASGLCISVALTTIFRDIFQIKPVSALGYSLGENSMLFGLGVWGDGDNLGARLRTSPLFQNRLAGPQNAVREYWGLPPVNSSESWGALWGNFLLMAPVERVEQAIANEPRVYLTHINTPRQVVIAGDPAACRRVIEALGSNSLRAPFDYVLHCQAMESDYQLLYDLHTWPVRQAPAVKMYSAADDKPFDMTETGIARAVANDLCARLDFPRLVETVYNDGARIFIELGAGSNCAKWIEDTLRGRPFLSISANRKGIDDATAIVRVLARLVSHQVKVDLAPLFPSVSSQEV